MESFPLFPSFPPEVRGLIWTQADSPTELVRHLAVNINWFNRHSKASFLRFLLAYGSLETLSYSLRVRSLLMVRLCL